MPKLDLELELNYEVINKFLQHCIRGTKEQHWPWNGPINIGTGYGDIVIKDRHHSAHRVSYLYFNSLKKIDKFILHKPECNNPWCVNPNHLYAGTQQDNINDQLKAGTFSGYKSCGEHRSTKFKYEDILNIRIKAMYMSNRELAQEYKCSHQHISDIVNYKIWKADPKLLIKPELIVKPIIEPLKISGIRVNKNRYITSTVVNIFLSHFNNVNKNDPNKCWLWNHSINGEGYGTFQIYGIHYKAHRVSCLYHNNMFYSDLMVLHKPIICTSRKCVNPNHLYLGNHSDNAYDREESKRNI